MSKSNIYHQKVERYYHGSQKDYEIIWGLKKHRSLHYGFWEKGIRNHEQAINNTTEQVAKYGIVREDMNVADLGCGIGGPALYLAQKYNCRVDGVSITERQVTQANQEAKRIGREDCKFYKEDYCHTSLTSDKYDMVYGIESYCHAEDKLDVLKESFRLLKPKGRLVVLDFFWKRELLNSVPTDSDQKAMKNWANSWAVSDFAYENEFEEKLRQSGFKNIQKKVVTKNVVPSIKRLYYTFIPGYIIDVIFRALRIRKGKHENLWSAYYQYQCWKRGLWDYCIFSAERA